MPPSPSPSVASSSTPPSYSYCPKDLVASFERLKTKEAELLARNDSHGGTAVPMDTSRSASSSSLPPMPNGSRNAPVSRIVVAATQITGAGLPNSDVAGYCFRAEQAIEQAVQKGANLILLPELWCCPYFCQSQSAVLLDLAQPFDTTNVLLQRMQVLAKYHKVVLPLSLYERCNQALYNSLVVIDCDGTIVGPTYRKSHIPDGTGYQEKFYFTPGDSGFQVYDTQGAGRIGVAICWDQWFPEAARAMALQGANVLLYPTAIGSEPQDPTLNSSLHWQRVMMGHSAANMVPVIASNRFGTEILLDDDGSEKQRITFYGKSFITDNTGAIVEECLDNYQSNGDGMVPDPVVVVTTEIDIEQNTRDRLAWGMFRDRRPDLYGALLTKDGIHR